MFPRAWPHPRIIGHRGGGTLAPENTLAGIRKAAETGIRGVEFDVMLSSDFVPVLMHDETLERTTSGHGNVSATPLAKLASLDAGSWFDPGYCDERVPSFESAGRLCIELGLWANVEIKPAAGFERETARVACVLARALWAGATPRPLLSSFQRACLEVARAAAPEFERGFLTDRLDAGWLESAKGLGCVSVHCNGDHMTREHAGEVKRAGFALLCYTVNDTESARRLFSWGVDAIFTDRLDRFSADWA
jgi:glycerophosphoryl diester phosphodiesterase